MCAAPPVSWPTPLHSLLPACLPCHPGHLPPRPPQRAPTETKASIRWVCPCLGVRKPELCISGSTAPDEFPEWHFDGSITFQSEAPTGTCISSLLPCFRTCYARTTTWGSVKSSSTTERLQRSMEGIPINGTQMWGATSTPVWTKAGIYSHGHR